MSDTKENVRLVENAKRRAVISKILSGNKKPVTIKELMANAEIIDLNVSEVKLSCVLAKMNIGGLIYFTSTPDGEGFVIGKGTTPKLVVKKVVTDKGNHKSKEARIALLEAKVKQIKHEIQLNKKLKDIIKNSKAQCATAGILHKDLIKAIKESE